MKRQRAFFIELQDEPSQPTDIEQPERLDLELLVMGKRSGLSFDEINELTVNDLLKYVNIYVDMETGKQKQRRRMATQADIDAFFA